MLTLKFSDLFVHHTQATVEAKIEQYVSIMSHVAPLSPAFQSNFAKFYQLRGEWRDPGKLSIFFSIFDDLLATSKTTVITYADVIGRFKPRNEKSFSSKILHTIYPDKPIIDQKALAKLECDPTFKTHYPTPSLVKRKGCGGKYNIIVGKNTVADSINFYGNLEAYYGILKSVPSTISYITDFDSWCRSRCRSKGINLSLISDTKKIDFWMWLA